MYSKFLSTCLSNNLEKVKTLKIPEKYILNDAFCKVCFRGYLDIAKYLYANGASVRNADGYYYNDCNYDAAKYACVGGKLNILEWLYEIGDELPYVFENACEFGRLNIAQWIHSLNPDIAKSDAFKYGFKNACIKGHLNIAKWLYELGVNTSDTNIFINTCANGHLEVVQWLHSIGFDISNTTSFIESCKNGHLHIAQWLYDKNISDPAAFVHACKNGHLHIAQWLHSLGTDISDPNALILSCLHKRYNIVTWLIEIHYKHSSHIYFKDYALFELEIIELLIDNDLLHPKQLSAAYLNYYLARTKGLVPADFDHPNTQGQRTKPARV